MAAFQVIINGRFWVITEAESRAGIAKRESRYHDADI
jgi:hypothetical protein